MAGMKRLFPLIAATAFFSASPAFAGDLETWDWFEARVALTDGQYGLPNSVRFVTDARFGTRYANGLGQMFFRFGPLWELHPNLLLGLQHTVYPNQFDPEGQPGVYEVVHRPELEPNLRARFGDFTLNDRNRFEYAVSSRTSFFRYRNQLRVNYQPAGLDWFPYVWNEVFYQSNAGLNQNRASVGIAHAMSPDTRLELGYILRSRSTPAGWENDHVANVYLLFAPQIKPAYPESLIPGGAGD